jgi:hypothetical protein
MTPLTLPLFKPTRTPLEKLEDIHRIRRRILGAIGKRLAANVTEWRGIKQIMSLSEEAHLLCRHSDHPPRQATDASAG